MSQTPSSERFATALQHVRISDLQQEMIKIHYQAPEHTLTATQMANALGYPHYSVSNGNYGRLGRLVGNALDWRPPSDSGLGVAVLCTFAKPEDHWRWIMRSEVAEAVERLGWVDPSTVPLPEEIDGSNAYAEGAIRQVFVNAYERNATARLACVKHHGYSCAACGITLADVYGDIGRNFIHVHHLTQLSEVGERYEVDPIKDLRPVCPNCHAMIHRRTPPYTIEEISQVLRSRKPRIRASSGQG